MTHFLLNNLGIRRTSTPPGHHLQNPIAASIRRERIHLSYPHSVVSRCPLRIPKARVEVGVCTKLSWVIVYQALLRHSLVSGCQPLPIHEIKSKSNLSTLHHPHQKRISSELNTDKNTQLDSYTARSVHSSTRTHSSTQSSHRTSWPALHQQTLLSKSGLWPWLRRSSLPGSSDMSLCFSAPSDTAYRTSPSTTTRDGPGSPTAQLS